MPNDESVPQGQGEDALSFDPREVDEQYEPFPNFSEWAKATTVPTERWERYLARIEEKRKDVSEDLLERAREVVRRAAAVDTGAIEGLYETNEGFTFTIARQAAAWEAVLGERDEQTQRLIKSQIGAYDYVLDFATEAREVREAWLRELHEVVTEGQETHTVYTQQGKQKRSLPKGEYKSYPNHVRAPNGTVHAYAPVEATPEEMHRLCRQLQSEEFKNAHPVQQASYAHYGLVVIHPFADGNGRVARALGSVYTYRAARIPLLVLADDRGEYLKTLRAADAGELQAFVEFVLGRCLDAIQLVDQSLKTAAAPSPGQKLESLDNLYVTRGGFTHDMVDSAADQFYKSVFRRAKELIESYESSRENLSAKISTSTSRYDPEDSEYRRPLKHDGKILNLQLTSGKPGRASVQRSYRLEVPRDAGRHDDIRLIRPDTGEAVTARVDQLIPNQKSTLQVTIDMWLEEQLGKLLDELSENTRAQLRRQGYLDTDS